MTRIFTHLFIFIAVANHTFASNYSHFNKEKPNNICAEITLNLSEIEATTDTHKPTNESFAFEMSDPARTYWEEFRFEKTENGIKITIVDEEGKILKGANLNIINSTDNQAIINNLLPEGEAFVELNPAKKYVATVAYTGYNTLQIELKPATQKEYIIKLTPQTFVSIGAFDKLSGKRLAANFKITYKDNVQELKGTLNADIRYKPIENGVYQIEVSHPNYVNKKESLNLENLTAGKSQFKINLESIIDDDYVILVRDAEDKQMISGAEIKLFDENKSPVPVKLNEKTGEWKIVLEKNKVYFIEVTANQYMKQTRTLQSSSSKLISIDMQKAIQTIFCSTIDAITKKPVAAQFKIIRHEQEPLNGTADVNKQFKVDLSPQKPYILEISADGYKKISETLQFDASKTEIESTKVFELQKDAYSFLFKVVDAQKKQLFSEAKLMILDLSTNQPISVKTEKNGFTANLVPGNNYSVSTEAEGYEKSTQNINARVLVTLNQFEHEIPMFRNPIENYKLVVLDEDKGSNVLNANLRIFNARNEPITITANPQASEWLAELKNEESYSVEIKADGYLAFRGPLQKNAKTIKLKVKKVPTQEIVFSPVDALSKKPIVAEFKLLSGGELITGAITSGGTKLKATLSQDKSYELEVTSSGYKTYKDAVNVAYAANNTITLELKKEAYNFTFKVLDTKSSQPVPNVKIKVLDTDNQAVTSKYNIETQDFQANLSTDKKYSVEVEALGYELYREKIDVITLATSSDFKRDIFMVKKEVEKKPEPKVAETKPIEKKISENKVDVKVTDNVKPIDKPEPITPPVVAKKAPEKKELEPKIFQNNATLITDDDAKVKVEVFENLEIGKRFRLSNVYFEQSSSQIRPQSFPQLDKLVNTMKLNPKMKIEIMGYTDNNGDPRLNLALSHFRATVVSNYLFNKGVTPERIKVIGKGQEEPIAPNDTEENRTKNRRVEFIIVEN